MFWQWSSWRDRLKSNSIFRALIISILLHLVAFLTIETGNRAGLWQMRILPQSAKNLTPEQLKRLQQQQSPQEQQTRLQFLDVDPAKQPEEPQNPKYYSSQSTVAANPDPKVELDRPKVDGKQDKVPKITDDKRAEAAPPPAPPQREMMSPTAQPKQQQQASKAEEPVGDTKENTLTPEEKAKRDVTMERPAQQTPQRPRTLADARAAKGITEGPKMKQDGGVKRSSLELSENSKGTPFGSYDAAFIAAVRKRWYDIIEGRTVQSGKVVIDFRLYKDGTVRNLTIAENQVNETQSWACQRAILDPAPYAPFPPDLRRMLDRDYREIRFTFYYEPDLY